MTRDIPSHSTVQYRTSNFLQRSGLWWRLKSYSEQTNPSAVQRKLMMVAPRYTGVCLILEFMLYIRGLNNIFNIYNAQLFKFILAPCTK